MHRGYVKLWRKSIDAGWLTNHKLWAFWCWCLLKASHKEMDQIVGYQKIHLMPGDFIFGRKVAAEELELTERSIRTNLDFLKNIGNLTIKTTNKFSVISIVNWITYQSEEISNDQQNDQPLTNNRPATDQPLTTNKNEKNEKNIRIKHSALVLPDWIKKETWDAFKEMRTRKRAPLTDRAAELIIAKLAKLKSSGQSPEAILNQSIERSWTGIFPIDNGGQYGQRRTGTGNERSLGRLGTPSDLAPPPEWKGDEDIPAISDEERERTLAKVKQFTASFGSVPPGQKP